MFHPEPANDDGSIFGICRQRELSYFAMRVCVYSGSVGFEDGGSPFVI
jgi:hypothetical protein